MNQLTPDQVEALEKLRADGQEWLDASPVGGEGHIQWTCYMEALKRVFAILAPSMPKLRETSRCDCGTPDTAE